MIFSGQAIDGSQVLHNVANRGTAEIKTKDRDQTIALYSAAGKGNVEIVEALPEVGSSGHGASVVLHLVSVCMEVGS